MTTLVRRGTILTGPSSAIRKFELLALSAARCRGCCAGGGCAGTRAIRRIAGTGDRSKVPMLVGLAVDEAPHVEPGRGVGFARRARIDALADNCYRDIVAFRNHG